MAYIADPRIPRKAAPMVLPSVASTMLNEEAGHKKRDTGPLEEEEEIQGKRKDQTEPQTSPGIFITLYT